MKGEMILNEKTVKTGTVQYDTVCELSDSTGAVQATLIHNDAGWRITAPESILDELYDPKGNFDCALRETYTSRMAAKHVVMAWLYELQASGY